MTIPKWCKNFTDKDFSSGPVMQQDGIDWMKDARSWMNKFLKSVAATEIEFHRGHYEWSMFALIGEQWWYFSSGDVRYKIMKSLLVRTAKSNRDYTGGINRYVAYDNENFEEALRRMVAAQ